MEPEKKENCQTLEYRVAQLEVNYIRLDGRMVDINEKQLPNILNRMISIETKIGIFTSINVFAVVFGIIISKLFN